MLVGAIGCVFAVAQRTGATTFDLPPETATLRTGPHSEDAVICIGCHSADYIATQPRPADPSKFWQAEVQKMRTAYGAPIDDEQAKAIVEYLATAYRLRVRAPAAKCLLGMAVWPWVLKLRTARDGPDAVRVHSW